MADNSIFATNVRIAILGGPGSGKTAFINTFFMQHITGPPYNRGLIKVYPCQFKIHNMIKRVLIFKFPADMDVLSLVSALEECRVNGIVLMYAIDDPSSFLMVMEHYILAIRYWKPKTFSQLPVVLVGSKSDLREDQRTIECLAHENKSPVTYAEGKNLSEIFKLSGFFEYSSIHSQTNEAIEFILPLAQAHFFALTKVQ